jgi:hypothetical protein
LKPFGAPVHLISIHLDGRTDCIEQLCVGNGAIPFGKQVNSDSHAVVNWTCVVWYNRVRGIVDSFVVVISFRVVLVIGEATLPLRL